MAPVEKVLEALSGHGCNPRQSAKGWSARCPCAEHDDKNASLSVGEGDDGRALLKCFKACPVEAICAALGLTVRDLMPTADMLSAPAHRNGKAATSRGAKSQKTFATAREAVAELERQNGKRSAIWTYHDRHGQPVGVVVRWNLAGGSKSIRPVSRRGDVWVIGGMVAPRALYGLPDLAGAERAYITEGEKAADAARSIGLTATTSAHGADSAEQTDWSPLAGKLIVLLPDNDDAGRDYAERVAALLAKLDPSPVVKVLELPGLPDKGDMADFVASRPGPNTAELRRLVDDLADGAPSADGCRAAASGPRVTTLLDAARDYVERIQQGKTTLIETGIADLDYAIGGGLAMGEMVVLASRPSHGKTMAALQMAHHWTMGGMTTVFVSEEMSASAMGKRLIQHASEVPEEHWRTSIAELEQDLRLYGDAHEKCILVESCGTVERAVEKITIAVKEHGAQAAVVDYAQLLGGKGRSRYEIVTNVSIALRQCVSQLNILLLVLAQISRAIESRPKFIPRMSDLKETGQLEQDADVVVFPVWPHRLDAKQHPHKYQFFVGKNRNRAINQAVVECKFNPPRQMILDAKSTDLFEPAEAESASVAPERDRWWDR